MKTTIAAAAALAAVSCMATTEPDSAVRPAAGVPTASAYSAIELVLTELETFEEAGGEVRVVEFDARVAGDASPFAGTVQLDLSLMFSGSSDLEANGSFSRLARRIQAQPWCRELRHEGSHPILGSSFVGLGVPKLSISVEPGEADVGEKVPDPLDTEYAIRTMAVEHQLGPLNIAIRRFDRSAQGGPTEVRYFIKPAKRRGAAGFGFDDVGSFFASLERAGLRVTSLEVKQNTRPDPAVASWRFEVEAARPTEREAQGG